MASWLKTLIGGLAGGAGAGADYYGKKRETERADEEKARLAEERAAAARQAQANFEKQFGLQESTAAATQARQQKIDAQADQDRLIANAERLGKDAPLTPQAREALQANGLPVQTTALPGQATKPLTLPSTASFALPENPTGSPSMTPSVSTPLVSPVGGQTLGKVVDKRGYQTPEEIAQERIALAITDAETNGRPEMAAMLRAFQATGGKMGGISGDVLKTTEQRKTEEAQKQANELALVGARNQAATGGQSSAVAEMEAPLDPESQDLMSQTGLSFQGFMAATGQMSQLGRDRVTRERAAKEVQDWARERGVDVSTLTSQFKAYNQTLRDNIERVNRTKMAEGEIGGDLENMIVAAREAGMNDARAINAAKQWLKGELNDPAAAQYAFFLNQLVNDIALYNAASQGRGTLNADMAEAQKLVQNGIAQGTLTGMQNALTSSVEKMGTVLQKGVDRARKNVWDLFGVGDKFKSTEQKSSTTYTPDIEAKIQLAVDEGYTREEAVAFLKSKGIIK